MDFIFDSTVTKVEVNAGMTEIKVFWKTKSNTENLESIENFFTINNFKLPKATQATLEQAIASAKAQYIDVALEASTNFLTQNYDTVEEMNADKTFVGMVNFNKDNRQITVNENGMDFIFDSTVTKVEVNAGMTEIKVFWKTKSNTENLESIENFFTINNFKLPKATQATLEQAIASAKAQYIDVALEASTNFLTQNYDTVEEMNADKTFVGMVNFNKDNRQITVNENGMDFIFDSTVTKVEVNAGMTEIKVFWKTKSNTENLESIENFFTINNFKVITKKVKLQASGSIVGGIMSAASIREFNNFYLTTEAANPLDDFDLNELTVKTDATVGLNGTWIFTKEQVSQIKASTTALLDDFNPIDITDVKTFADFSTYADQIFPAGVKDDDLQELFILKEKTLPGFLQVSNASAVALIKKTYFNDQFPAFMDIELNGGKPINSGILGAANDVKLSFFEIANPTNRLDSKIRINVDMKIDGTEGTSKIKEAYDNIKTFATDKLARLDKLFEILQIENPEQDFKIVFVKFSTAMVTSMINAADDYIPALGAIYKIKFIGKTVEKYVNKTMVIVVQKMISIIVK